MLTRVAQAEAERAEEAARLQAERAEAAQRAAVDAALVGSAGKKKRVTDPFAGKI